MNSSEYPVIIDYPWTTFLVLFALNVLFTLLAFYFCRKRVGLFVHAVNVIWLLASPFVLLALVTPRVPFDEEPGPGDGIIAIPLAAEVLLILLFYCVYFLAIGFQHLRTRRRIRTGV